MPQFWNDRYASTEYVYGKAPNIFFKEQIQLLQPGSLFIPGAGEGRDAVYAATLGWQVMALDQSMEGKRKALQLAIEQDVSIGYEVMDIQDYDFSSPRFDAIALIYFHLPSALREKIYPQLADLLNPGGTLILEAFHPLQLNYLSGGPKEKDMLICADDLKRSFAKLDFLDLTETEITLEEGPFHQGPAYVTRLTARKH